MAASYPGTSTGASPRRRNEESSTREVASRGLGWQGGTHDEMGNVQKQQNF